jgi:hypothetical protein
VIGRKTMRKTLSYVAVAAMAFASAALLPDALAQEGTLTPGQPTQARVLIGNRERDEAVPVTIQGVASDVAPIRVELGPRTVVDARVVAQQWEYQILGIPAGSDATAALNAAGTNGWETTGLMLSTPQGNAVVMKRPR